MKSKIKYDSKNGSPYYNHGEIIEDGESYDTWYGANYIYITADDIGRIKNGAMFYYTDGEYAYCLVYKEDGEGDEFEAEMNRQMNELGIPEPQNILISPEQAKRLNLTDKDKEVADKAAKLIARDYGEVLKKLGEE